MCYLPIGELRLAIGIFGALSAVGPLGLLGGWLAKDFWRTIRGESPPPPRQRLRESLALFRDHALLAVVFSIVLIAYVNLKPAIPLLNPENFDGWLETVERCFSTASCRPSG